MTQQKRNWLITGCSTGLGRALAQVLIDQGERVFATARNVQALDDLVADHPDAIALKLDVTQPDDIAAVLQEVDRHGGVDVLVNNAGYGYIAAVEEADEQEYRDLFETNVFGLIAITRAALKGMRERGRGHIVNIASVGGIVGNPGSAYYAATKFAVIGFSEALAKETQGMGIKVTAVAPGPFRTDWAGRSLKTAKTPIPAYAQTVHARQQQLNAYSGHQPGDPVRGAQAIIQAVDSENPPLRLVLGAPGLKMAREQLQAIGREFDAWEAVTLASDFPPGA